ncbi:MAG TPA: hypothetical protein PLU46_00025 [Thiotrichales bacterium]|nr:hypothetical protein [Thiotrichales bacterium]
MNVMPTPLENKMSNQRQELNCTIDMSTMDSLLEAMIKPSPILSDIIAQSILSLIPLRLGWNEIMQLDRDVHALADVLASQMVGGHHELSV